MTVRNPPPQLQLATLVLGDESFRRELEAGAARIHAGLARFVDHVFGGPEKMQETLQRMVQNVALLAAELPKVEQTVAAAEKSVFERLIDYAWFFNPEMGTHAFLQIANFVDAGHEDEVNRIMVENFRARLDGIAVELAANHPARGQLLAEAFAAHREKRYALSIPVFLAQADGISRELLGSEYFTFVKSKGPTEALIVQVAGDCFLESALRALVPKGAMRQHTSQARLGMLNRHGVLHGLDTSYDSELNSLKAISLLNFLSTMNSLKQKRLTPTGGA